MGQARATSNKAKIARRVVEVLEFFDDDHHEATVMDIVRRYDRPQSSTSELLSSLVELGLLFKDPYSRNYTLSPRAALLGTGGQPSAVRDGALIRVLDRLSAQTGLSVALFGRVCLNVQITSWRSGARPCAATRDLFGGMQHPLSDSAIGWLMLSTIEQPRRDGVVRRLIAEASDDFRMRFGELNQLVDHCHDAGYAHGPIGFGSKAHAVAVLLPGQPADRPLAVGLAFAPDRQINPASLMECVTEAVGHCLIAAVPAPGSIKEFSTAA